MKPKKTSPRTKASAAPSPRRTAAAKTKSSAKVAARTSRRLSIQSEAPEPAVPKSPRVTNRTVRKSVMRKAPMKIPSILLEGDKPSAPGLSGPGHRYALGPAPVMERLEAEGELPEAYGTRQLLLAARDPHWLYAHWDLTREQQQRYNRLSRDKHLVLRVFLNAVSSRPAHEVHVHPESLHWFIHVVHAGAKYLAELGYYPAVGGWVTISTSGATLTPPDTMSTDTTEEFTTIPFEIPMAKLLLLVKEAVRDNVPLARALEDLRVAGHPGLPPQAATTATTPAPWTPAQERALAAVISMDHVRRVWMGSLEITELIRRQVVQEMASMSAAQLGGSVTSPAGISSSLFGGGAQPEKGFWFNVNAELIIYGATEPKASVTIGGRRIKLRPDGSFSYRFALPDGKYELPIVAISEDETDGRAAEMKFSRSTEYRGDVGAHPQDPDLRQLILENF